MYLGQVRRVEKRKPAECALCKEVIPSGETCFVVVKKATSKRGKGYLWTVYIHLDCFIDWSKDMQEKRAKYTAERRGGRPPGSAVQQFAEDWPELAQERHKCIRDRARLMRYIIGSDNPTKIFEWADRILILDRRIKEILPLQVEKPGRRTDKSRQQLAAVLRAAQMRAARAGR